MLGTAGGLGVLVHPLTGTQREPASQGNPLTQVIQTIVAVADTSQATSRQKEKLRQIVDILLWPDEAFLQANRVPVERVREQRDKAVEELKYIFHPDRLPSDLTTRLEPMNGGDQGVAALRASPGKWPKTLLEYPSVKIDWSKKGNDAFLARWQQQEWFLQIKVNRGEIVLAISHEEWIPIQDPKRLKETCLNRLTQIFHPDACMERVEWQEGDPLPIGFQCSGALKEERIEKPLWFPPPPHKWEREIWWWSDGRVLVLKIDRLGQDVPPKPLPPETGIAGPLPIPWDEWVALWREWFPLE